MLFAPVSPAHLRANAAVHGCPCSFLILNTCRKWNFYFKLRHPPGESVGRCYETRWLWRRAGSCHLAKGAGGGSREESGIAKAGPGELDCWAPPAGTSSAPCSRQRFGCQFLSCGRYYQHGYGVSAAHAAHNPILLPGVCAAALPLTSASSFLPPALQNCAQEAARQT